MGLVRTSGGDQAEEETELAIFRSQTNIEACVSELDIAQLGSDKKADTGRVDSSRI